MGRRPAARSFEDLILTRDLVCGDTVALVRSLDEVNRLLNPYAGAILASDF